LRVSATEAGRSCDAAGAKRMQMPGGRHDTSVDSLPLWDSVGGRRRRLKSRSSRTGRRYKTAAEAGAPTAAMTEWTDGDMRQNHYSSEDNIDDHVDRGAPSPTDDVLSTSTLDRSRSRFNKIMDAVGKPFARRRSKSADALSRFRPPSDESRSPLHSTDEQLSHSAHTSGSASMVALTHFANGQVPGVVGIRNHGNTCFMNAIIQCLSNTEFFAEYFVTSEFQTVTAAARNTGRMCTITNRLRQLLSSLWTCDYSYDISASFRAVIGKSAVQYQGTEQNDAQEFLQWLLDCVNDELYGTGISDNRALCSVKNEVNKCCFVIISFFSVDFSEIVLNTFIWYSYRMLTKVLGRGEFFLHSVYVLYNWNCYGSWIKSKHVSN